MSLLINNQYDYSVNDYFKFASIDRHIDTVL